MNKLEELDSKLRQSLAIIKEAVDESIDIMDTDSTQIRSITQAWEYFLRETLTYIKQRGRETGRNLFASISFKRIWPK